MLIIHRQDNGQGSEKSTVPDDRQLRDRRYVTDQAAFDRELQVNREAYEAIKDELKAKYSGQYVGIAFGKLIAAGPVFDEVLAAVDALQPQPQHIMVFPADEAPGFGVIMEY